MRPGLKIQPGGSRPQLSQNGRRWRRASCSASSVVARRAQRAFSALLWALSEYRGGSGKPVSLLPAKGLSMKTERTG
eukprot:11699198-Alexandrium_andersonii.AAC.1